MFSMSLSFPLVLSLSPFLVPVQVSLCELVVGRIRGKDMREKIRKIQKGLFREKNVGKKDCLATISQQTTGVPSKRMTCSIHLHAFLKIHIHYLSLVYEMYSKITFSLQ